MSYSDNDTVQSNSLERDDDDNAVSPTTCSHSPLWMARNIVQLLIADNAEGATD